MEGRHSTWLQRETIDLDLGVSYWDGGHHFAHHSRISLNWRGEASVKSERVRVGTVHCLSSRWTMVLWPTGLRCMITRVCGMKALYAACRAAAARRRPSIHSSHPSGWPFASCRHLHRHTVRTARTVVKPPPAPQLPLRGARSRQTLSSADQRLPAAITNKCTISRVEREGADLHPHRRCMRGPVWPASEASPGLC